MKRKYLVRTDHEVLGVCKRLGDAIKLYAGILKENRDLVVYITNAKGRVVKFTEKDVRNFRRWS